MTKGAGAATLKPMKKMSSVLLASVVIWLSGCAASTPANRVAHSPQLFEPLSSSQKQAVMEGRVEEGMPPDAVYLALGRPDRVIRGSEQGTPYEHWRYMDLQPVYHSSWAMGYGPVYRGPYGRRYYAPGWGTWDMGPDYIPVTSAVVRFSRNRVTGWERLR